MERTALLWHSNAPWAPTGYGQQTALFCERLRDHYDLSLSAFYGLEAAVIPWYGVPVLPGVGTTAGNDTLPIHAKSVFPNRDLRGGMVVTLMDVWVLDPAIGRKLNLVCWTPIDHDPPPPKVLNFLDSADAIPMAMSEFGRDRLERAGFEPLYVPHAVDAAVYHPIDQAEARERTRIPDDRFVVGMVAANKGNPSRKCFTEALLAFRDFHARHDDAILYLHTDVHGVADGVDLKPLIESLGLQRETLFTNQERLFLNPYRPESMAAVYSSLDVLLSPSAGEGFGIPVLEAQSCGVPAIVSDFTAQPEVCGAGWHVEVERTNWTPANSWQARPVVADIVEALRGCYSMGDSAREQLSRKARAHAETYHIDRVFEERMLPAIALAQERFADRAPFEVAA